MIHVIVDGSLVGRSLNAQYWIAEKELPVQIGEVFDHWISWVSYGILYTTTTTTTTTTTLPRYQTTTTTATTTITL